MQKTIYLLLMLILVVSCQQQPLTQQEAIEESITWQLQQYPKSTLKDIYKNFFQDRFGPGHLISDTAAAQHYLDWELANSDNYGCIAVEPIGWQQQHYRISLELVAQGIIPSETLRDAFIESANTLSPVQLADWKQEWHCIDSIIKTQNIKLPDYEADLDTIEQRLEQGYFVGHHSRAYNHAYDPHYRIIAKHIYKRDIEPLLPDSIRKATLLLERQVIE